MINIVRQGKHMKALKYTILFMLSVISLYGADNSIVYKNGQTMKITSNQGIELNLSTNKEVSNPNPNASFSMLPSLESTVAGDKIRVGDKTLNDFLNSVVLAKLEWIVKDYVQFKQNSLVTMKYLYDFAHFDYTKHISEAKSTACQWDDNGTLRNFSNVRSLEYVPDKMAWLATQVSGEAFIYRLDPNTNVWKKLGSYPGVKTKESAKYHERSEIKWDNCYIRRLKFDPFHKTVIALNRGDGPWYSSDAGNTWKHLGKRGEIDNLELYSVAVGVDGVIIISSNKNLWRLDGSNLDNDVWKEIKPDQTMDLDIRAVESGTFITSYGIPEWGEDVYHFPDIDGMSIRSVASGNGEINITRRSVFVCGVSQSHLTNNVCSLFYSIDNGNRFIPCPNMNGKNMCAVRGIAFKNGRFVVSKMWNKFGSGSDTNIDFRNSTGVWYSNDGMVWERANTPKYDELNIGRAVPTYLYEPSYYHGHIIVPILYQNAMMVSADGKNWDYVRTNAASGYIISEGNGDMYCADHRGLEKIDTPIDVASKYIYSKKEVDAMIEELKGLIGEVESLSEITDRSSK